MAQWGNQDQANNSVLWGPALVRKTVNTANRDALFGNTTANAFIEGVTTGQYGVDTGEMLAVRELGNPRPAHAGWVLRTEGQGGRSGRVFHEVLVAGSTITGDANDDAKFPDFAIVITSQPADATANADNDDVATFTVSADSVPAGANLAFLWQADTGSGFANLSNAGAYSNVTTATLSVLANTAANGEQYRVVISTTGADAVTSDAATLTITTA